MSTLTKAKIAEALKEALPDSSGWDYKTIVDSVFEEILANLATGQSMKISGFGTFMLRDKPERPGCNPKTKEPKVVAARRVVSFRAGQKLKSRLESINKSN